MYRGIYHGLSIYAASCLYYRPSTFRNRPDRQAPGIPHQRLVPLQPGDQPGPAPRLTGWTHPKHQPTGPVHTPRARKASDGEQILNHSALHRGRCGYGQLAPYWA